MNRHEWQEFICSPSHAGRHLSSIGRSIRGATSDAVDVHVLDAFLTKLRGADADASLLANAVDLAVGDYSDFAARKLPRILDALSNEMVRIDEVVGPGLRGNPRWDRTMVGRVARTLPLGKFVSRTAHRSFLLPENLLLRWLVSDLRRTLLDVKLQIGSHSLTPQLQELDRSCETALRHYWFSDLEDPLTLEPPMFLACARHRRPEYRSAGELAKRRKVMSSRDRASRWNHILSLLAVNWLEPIDDDDLFELYVLVLVLDVIGQELHAGDPVQFGLVTGGRSYVARFERDDYSIEVYFDQSLRSAMGAESRYRSAVRAHAGVSGGERRPDVVIVARRGGRDQRTVIVEAKRTDDGRYISDSIYKVFGYLYDHQEVWKGTRQCPKAILIVPDAVNPIEGAVLADHELLVVSGTNREMLAQMLHLALS